MKNILKIIVFLLLSFPMTAQELLTAEEAVKIALENNYQIRIASNELKIDRASATVGNAGMLPTVGASATSNNSIQNTSQVRAGGERVEQDNARNNSLNYGVALDWTIFDGFSMFARYDQLQELEKLGDAQLQQTILMRVRDVLVTYYDLVQENPFVSPTLFIQPTDVPYDAYLGAKGKLTNSIAYNFRGSYISEFNKALFLKNPFNPGNNTDYSYGNSFGVVYDDVTTLSFFAEINVDVRRNFKLNMNAAYFSYSGDLQPEAWNLPDFKASILADYQITDKWFAGANVFFIGERKDLVPVRNNDFSVGAPTIQTLDSFIDLNANVGYRFNNQLSIFAKGNNLLGNSYERWGDFPIQGIQVLAGATYKFDF